MKIDGRYIADELKSLLKKKINSLRQKNIIPHLTVIIVGQDPSSQTYVKQKEKVGSEIGVKVSVIRKQVTDDKGQIINIVKKLNSDPSVHGIIIQRPLPMEIEENELNRMVIPKKDVDGFHPLSPFTPPVASAVIKILKYVHRNINATGTSSFNTWLKKRKILVIGRGETAGKPIAKKLNKMGINIEIAHSKTSDLIKVCLDSDIIITCVGRPDIVRHDMVTNKTILIGVGLHPENDRLHTDYNQEEISLKTAFWTPVPGGVGPVNVACLFENLIASCN